MGIGCEGVNDKIPNPNFQIPNKSSLSTAVKYSPLNLRGDEGGLRVRGLFIPPVLC
jgi:hypothetical protein